MFFFAVKEKTMSFRNALSVILTATTATTIADLEIPDFF
jgi:hypothetical protein